MKKKLTTRDILKFCSIMEQYNPEKEIDSIIDKEIEKLPKNCHTCQDYIVCWQMEEVGDRVKDNCPNWHLDFMIYQDLLDKNEATKSKSTVDEQK